jgi:plasmid maintenance system antidote protein VapI
VACYDDKKTTHPGNVFLGDVMKPLNLTVAELRISKATYTSIESWMTMQQNSTSWNNPKH